MESVPVLTDADARRDSIAKNTPAVFIVEENTAANGAAPWYEMEIASEVSKWCGLIHVAASKHRIDVDLAKAIIFMETTHGWYDMFYPFDKTILPMNINYQYWRQLGVSKELIGLPFYNIEYGVILLSRIAVRVHTPTPRKIATLYNFIGAQKVSDYGARVANIMSSKPWLNTVCQL